MSIPWLKELEERVRDTAVRLAELRAENESLKSRVAELEAQAAAAPAAEELEAWTAEREEIRGRVEKLAEHLEKLLQDE